MGQRSYREIVVPDSIGVEGEVKGIGLEKAATLLIHILSYLNELVVEIDSALTGKADAVFDKGDVYVIEIILLKELILIEEAPERIEASDRGIEATGIGGEG